MPDPNKSSGGSGDSGSQGGSEPGKSDPTKTASPEKQGEGQAGASGEGQSGSAGGKSIGGDDPGKQYVTPNILQSVLDAHKRTVSGELKKTHDTIVSLNSKLEEITKNLATTKGKEGEAEGGGKPKSEAEQKVISLQRQIDELTGKLKDEADRANQAESKRRDSEFKTAVMKALNDAGCEKPEEAFLVIKPRLEVDDADSKIFATLKGPYGDEHLELKTYIEREFRENVLPHVFRGKMRTGSPAGGDSGGGGSYEFTKEQALDPAQYAKDPEKFRAAIQSGKVKGIPRPGAAAKSQS